MFRVIILEKPIKNLFIKEVRDAFCDSIALRQSLFQEQNALFLSLDKYDLISTHLILYYDDKPIAYFRVTNFNDCVDYKQPLPIEATVSGDNENKKLLDNFIKTNPNPIHLGLLCKDKGYNKELFRVNILHFMVWIAITSVGEHFSKVGFCSTPNADNSVTKQLRSVGECYVGNEFIHPQVPKIHELVIVNQVSTEQWEKWEKIYSSIISEIKVINQEGGVIKKVA